MRRVIRRLASEFINPLTAATHGRTLLRIRVFRRPEKDGSIAMPYSGHHREHLACKRRPRTAGPAFDGRSISSIVVDPGNANILYVSSDARRARHQLCHGRCRLRSLPVFRRMDCGSPPMAEQTSRY